MLRAADCVITGGKEIEMPFRLVDSSNMKIATIIARILLGLVFTVFGSNAFLHFIPMPPMSGPAGDFMTAMFSTHYIYVPAFCQVAGGLILLIGLVSSLIAGY